jgi:hypothetical protein
MSTSRKRVERESSTTSEEEEVEQNLVKSEGARKKQRKLSRDEEAEREFSEDGGEKPSGKSTLQ